MPFNVLNDEFVVGHIDLVPAHLPRSHSLQHAHACSKRNGTKQNLTQNGHSRSRVLESLKGDKGLSNTK